MRTEREAWTRPLGATRTAEGLVEFRVWAPNAQAVAVRVNGEDSELEHAGDGVWEGEVEARPGDDYLYVLDGGDAWGDPCSRFQPEGIRGPSRVVDTASFAWTDDEWDGIALDDLVLYELHVGTFTPEGTFDAAIPRLGALRELGVTALEVMPIADFPGNRGWGYDGIYLYAPHRAYGGPDGFARLVDAAHAEGLAVVLDVVYNHLGPGNERISAFGPYFTDRYETGWGQAINYDGEGSGAVREWAIQNALMWIRDYHVDGLRLDATHAIFDESPRHVLAELAERVKEASPHALITSEMEIGDYRPLEEWGHDAEWGDWLHHAVHVLLTGETEGYYARYGGTVEQLARALEDPHARRLVVCAQNHDQVGNRAVGDRLRGRKLRLAAFCSILAPGIPLLFMGEEHDEPSPFQFFTDHVDPFIADATRNGRREEFAEFAAFSGEEVPDPQAPETFQRSKLSWRVDEQHRAYYAELLRLRRQLPRGGALDVSYDEEGRWLRVRREGAELFMNFSEVEVEGVPPLSGRVRR